MLPKRFKIPLKIFSVLILFLFVFTSCAQGPAVTVCIVDDRNQVFQCRDPKGKVFSLTMQKANNYICMSPDDTEALLNYCKRK